jgi:hypothetical protein
MKSFYMYVIVLLAVFAMVSAYSITADCAPGGPEPRENSVVNTTQPIDGSDRITWTTLPPSPAMARYWCPGTGVVRDTIYFLGGRGSPTGTLAEIIAYVPANNSWVTTGLPTLLTPRRTGGGGRIGNKIYVAGGRDASNTFHLVKNSMLIQNSSQLKLQCLRQCMPALVLWLVANYT